MARRQGTYWLGTISCDQQWEPSLPEHCCYLRGQREMGAGGFEHWQVFFITSSKHSCVALTRLWSPVVGHWELTRSAAAESYVWKDDTRVGEPFEFGTRPFKRNSSTDWDVIKTCAVAGELDTIPADIFIRYYRTLQAIASDHSVPVAMERHCVCFWGPTGTGKSRAAWDLGGDSAYPKDPRSKFWCGYRDQSCVIFDEFRGGIDISHILRWTDRYPVTVEIKGSSRPLLATRFIFTSNLHPRDWYPTLDPETVAALYRRFTEIKEFTNYA